MIPILNNTDLESILGSGVDGTDHAAVKMFVREACKAGLAVLFCHPGTKIPADLRTSRTRSADDKAAKAAAQEAGRRDWQRVKSPSGLALATTDNKVAEKYLAEYVKIHGAEVHVNIGIELGKSKLIVVDCDTAAQVSSFLECFDAPEDLPPTILSPGAQDADGTWIHSDGGHYYFTIPDGVQLPTNIGAMNWGGEDSFAILWRQRQVLIPPSVRPEGAYELLGRPYPAFPELIEAITERAAIRAAKYRDGTPSNNPDDDLAPQIDAWADTISWDDILAPLGWTTAQRPDNCGCPVWTAPGSHTSPKSATAHDAGCSLGRYTATNAPLHIWTDNPGEPFDVYVESQGTQTISKLQAVAWAEYDGSIGNAMDQLGLKPDLGIEAEEGVDTDAIGNDEVDTGNLNDEITLPTPAPADQSTVEPGENITCACGVLINPDMGNVTEDSDGDWWHNPVTGDIHLVEITDDPALDATPAGQDEPGADDETFPVGEDAYPDQIVFQSDIAGTPLIAPFSYWRDTPAPEYVIDGLLEHGGLTSIIGPPNVGKSCVALDMACHIATGQRWQGRKTLKTRVLYLPGEGRAGAVQRLRAWEGAHGLEVGDDLLLGDSIIQLGASKEAWAWVAQIVIEQSVGLIIFDTLARMSLGLEENSATDMGRAVVRFDQIRKLTNAGVLIVHHTAKGNPSAARGSSAINGALDSELLVSPGAWAMDLPEGVDPPGKPIQLTTTKQKNAEQLDDPMPMCMISFDVGETTAPLVTGITGTVDPMDGEILMARPIAESIVETACRIKDYLGDFPTQGATRADIAAHLAMDGHTRTRKDAAKHWKQQIAKAIDLGLRLELLETATGAALGARYVPGITSKEVARNLFAEETITDVPASD